MLYRLEIVTEDQMTIERPTQQEAEDYARAMEKEMNSHYHHGEKTIIKVVHVPYAK